MTVSAELLEPTRTTFKFCGEELLIDPRGCLVWPAEKLLVVSDLHLEKGSSFAARRNVFLPPYDTQASLDLLSDCIFGWEPETVISLGDSFHDDDASGRLPKNCRVQIQELMTNRNWIWVSGNHDPSPPESLGGTHCTAIQLGPLNFKHDPEITFEPGEIAGHLHPKAKIRQRGKTVRRRCLVCDGDRIILPAFGAYTGGLNIRDAAFANLLDPEKLEAWLLSRDGVYKMAARRLLP